MGRNGKKEPVFTRLVEFVNGNVGKIVTSQEILLGNEPSRAAETAYLYKLIKLGYVRPANKGFVMHKDTTYEILKPFPPKYNSVALMKELRIANGLIPENNTSKIELS
jgi:hypothetical protein